MSQLDSTAEVLVSLVKRALLDPVVDRSAITQAAVALFDATARADEDDDETLVELADWFGEQAALWAYFKRPTDDLTLRNAMRSYEMAARAIRYL